MYRSRFVYDRTNNKNLYLIVRTQTSETVTSQRFRFFDFVPVTQSVEAPVVTCSLVSRGRRDLTTVLDHLSSSGWTLQEKQSVRQVHFWILSIWILQMGSLRLEDLFTPCRTHHSNGSLILAILTPRISCSVRNLRKFMSIKFYKTVRFCCHIRLKSGLRVVKRLGRRGKVSLEFYKIESYYM